jgi:para-nitrobenzyl esterase
MLGTNRDENKLFLFGDPRRVRQILWFIPHLRDERQYNLNAEYVSKMWKAIGADEPASAMQRTQGPSIFVYRFDWDEEPTVLGADLSVMLGAAHGFEIPFVFGHYDLGREGSRIFTAENRLGREALSSAMMSYWTEFAYSGLPGRGRDGRQPEWTPWDGADNAETRFIVLDTAAGGGLRMSSGALTRPSVLNALASDPRLPAPYDRCAILREMAEWSLGLSKEEYAEIGNQTCAKYPLDAYPWRH